MVLNIMIMIVMCVAASCRAGHSLLVHLIVSTDVSTDHSLDAATLTFLINERLRQTYVPVLLASYCRQ